MSLWKLFKSCFSSLSLSPWHWKKGCTISLVPDQGRNLCPHSEGRVGMEFQISTSSPLIILPRRGAWPPWTPLWEDDSEISDHPGGLLGYDCNREGQGMSLVPSGDEYLGTSTLDFFNTTNTPSSPRQGRRFGKIC